MGGTADQGTNVSAVVSEHSTDSQGERRRWPLSITALMIALGCALAAWGRLPGGARGTMWAEDGQFFSQRALHPELLTAWIFTPLDGYSHAIPQSTALLLWALVPIDRMALAFTAAACLIAGAVAACVFILTAHWRLGTASRLLLALTTVLAPTLAYEVLGNLTNVHWLLLWLTPFLFLARPRSMWSSVGWGVVAFAIMASEIVAVMFIPLLLWRVRDGRRWPIVIGVLAGTGVQLIAFLGGSRLRSTESPSIASVIQGFFLQVPLSGIAGTGQGASALVGYSGWMIAYAALVPFVLCAAWFAQRSPRRWALVGVFVGGAVVIWSVGFAVNYVTYQDFASYTQNDLLAGIPILRYAAVPILFLFAVAALAVRAHDDGRRRRLTPVAVGVLVLSLTVFAASYRVEDRPWRAAGPYWAPTIEDARASCAEDGIGEASVPIAPQGIGWHVDIPCARLG